MHARAPRKLVPCKRHHFVPIVAVQAITTASGLFGARQHVGYLIPSQMQERASCLPRAEHIRPGQTLDPAQRPDYVDVVLGNLGNLAYSMNAQPAELRLVNDDSTWFSQQVA